MTVATGVATSAGVANQGLNAASRKVGVTLAAAKNIASATTAITLSTAFNIYFEVSENSILSITLCNRY